MKVEAAPESENANGSFKSGGVDAGTCASVGTGAGVDDVDKGCPMSDFPNGTNISCCVAPSKGDNVAAGGMSCSADTAPGTDACVGYGLVCVGKAGEIAVWTWWELSAISLSVVGSDREWGLAMMVGSLTCCRTVRPPEGVC